MASYTMQLKEYIESFSYPNQDTMKRSDVIEAGRTKLFDFDYPIVTAWKQEFETNFIRNFYMREIGFETEGLFKLALENWLNINMDYWVEMYNSTLLSYDPLKNSSMDVSHNKTNSKTKNDSANTSFNSSSNDTRTNNNTVTEDNFNRVLESNNPDTRLELTANDGQGVIEYASAIEENNTNNSTTSNGTDTNNGTQSGTKNDTLNSSQNDTENFTQHRDGKIGVQTYAKMIQEHRDIFLRIDKMIFKEMQELFMLVY